jgi:hypothetical protein
LIVVSLLLLLSLSGFRRSSFVVVSSRLLPSLFLKIIATAGFTC